MLSWCVLLALVVLACSTAKSSRYGAAKVAVAKEQRAFGEDAAEPPTASMSPVACGTSSKRGQARSTPDNDERLMFKAACRTLAAVLC